jgi:hypothetical protein
VSDTDEVKDAVDLFVRDASGTECRCYVAADASEAQSGSTREHGGTARPLVRELSAESVHAIDRLTALLVDDYSNVYSVEQWDAEASHDSHTARKVLMNSNSVRVVPGSEGSYGLKLTATDAYHFAFPSVTDTEDATVPTSTLYPAPPASYAEAIKGADAPEWQRAMQEELAGHVNREEPTWRRWTGKGKAPTTPIPTMWLYKRKACGRYKARLVVLGNRTPFDPVPPASSSPTASRMALLILLVFAAVLGLSVRHLDVVQAYINAPVPKAGQYYITVPGIAGIQELLRCLYGMPFSGRSWWELVDSVLRNDEHQFKPCDSEPCVYTRGSGKNWVCVLLYVDDLLIFGACAKTVEKLVVSLCARFKMNDLGTPTRYLGMMITREDGHITVNQREFHKLTVYG